jgi:hypothetical protein
MIVDNCYEYLETCTYLLRIECILLSITNICIFQQSRILFMKYQIRNSFYLFVKTILKYLISPESNVNQYMNIINTFIQCCKYEQISNISYELFNNVIEIFERIIQSNKLFTNKNNMTIPNICQCLYLLLSNLQFNDERLIYLSDSCLFQYIIDGCTNVYSDGITISYYPGLQLIHYLTMGTKEQTKQLIELNIIQFY